MSMVSGTPNFAPLLARISNDSWHGGVQRPRGERRSTPVSSCTLVRDRSIAHRMFKKAMQWGLIDRNPVSLTDRPKIDRRDPVLLRPEQLQALYDACTDRPMVLTYVTLLAETGVRCESEALWLTWEDVHLEDGFIWIDSSRDGHRTKTGKGRWVPITQALRPSFETTSPGTASRNMGSRPNRRNGSSITTRRT